MWKKIILLVVLLVTVAYGQTIVGENVITDSLVVRNPAGSFTGNNLYIEPIEASRFPNMSIIRGSQRNTLINYTGYGVISPNYRAGAMIGSTKNDFIYDPVYGIDFDRFLPTNNSFSYSKYDAGTNTSGIITVVAHAQPPGSLSSWTTHYQTRTGYYWGMRDMLQPHPRNETLYELQYTQDPAYGTILRMHSGGTIVSYHNGTNWTIRMDANKVTIGRNMTAYLTVMENGQINIPSLQDGGINFVCVHGNGTLFVRNIPCLP